MALVGVDRFNLQASILSLLLLLSLLPYLSLFLLLLLLPLVSLLFFFVEQASVSKGGLGMSLGVAFDDGRVIQLVSGLAVLPTGKMLFYNILSSSLQPLCDGSMIACNGLHDGKKVMAAYASLSQPVAAYGSLWQPVTA